MDGVTEVVVEKGPEWITALSALSPLVAIALLLVGIVALFVWSRKADSKSTLDTMKLLSECYVKPISDAMESVGTNMTSAVGEMKTAVTNHYHDIETRLQQDGVDREGQRRAFEDLVKCIKDREGGKT